VESNTADEVLGKGGIPDISSADSVFVPEIPYAPLLALRVLNRFIHLGTTDRARHVWIAGSATVPVGTGVLTVIGHSVHLLSFKLRRPHRDIGERRCRGVGLGNWLRAHM
jgi:hypothetical protein